MGPFLLVKWTGGSNAGGLQVYGGYADYASAEAALAKQSWTSDYYIVQNFMVPTNPIQNPYTNQGLTAGNFCCIKQSFGLSSLTLLSYGPFSSYQAAEAFVASLPYSGGIEIAQVQTAK